MSYDQAIVQIKPLLYIIEDFMMMNERDIDSIDGKLLKEVRERRDQLNVLLRQTYSQKILSEDRAFSHLEATIAKIEKEYDANTASILVRRFKQTRQEMKSLLETCATPTLDDFIERLDNVSKITDDVHDKVNDARNIKRILALVRGKWSKLPELLSKLKNYMYNRSDDNNDKYKQTFAEVQEICGHMDAFERIRKNKIGAILGISRDMKTNDLLISVHRAYQEIKELALALRLHYEEVHRFKW